MRKAIRPLACVALLAAGCSQSTASVTAVGDHSAVMHIEDTNTTEPISTPEQTPLELLADNPAFELVNVQADIQPRGPTLLGDETYNIPATSAPGFPSVEYRYLCDDDTMAQVHIVMLVDEKFFDWETYPHMFYVVTADPERVSETYSAYSAEHRHITNEPSAFAREWAEEILSGRATFTGGLFATTVPVQGAPDVARVVLTSARTWQDQPQPRPEAEVTAFTEPYTAPIECAHNAWKATGFRFP